VPLNHDIVGAPSAPSMRSWTTTDVLLYALGVGAGQDDPLSELEFTTENTIGVATQVLPTFGTMLSRNAQGLKAMGDFDRAAYVHAEQAFTLHRTIPVEGTARSTSTVVGMYDKGSGALVVSEASCADAATGEPLVTSRGSIFIRGEGGFGGDRGPAAEWRIPERSADVQVTYETRPEQALVYRLSGDRNPLHSDPAFAARGGFHRPILHGMCTYGYTGRALLHAVCGSDPARFKSMEGRFTSPLFPGDPLTISIWVDGGTALFRTSSNGTVAIDRGRLTFVP
jgi:acyl dehydratase